MCIYCVAAGMTMISHNSALCGYLTDEEFAKVIHRKVSVYMLHHGEKFHDKDIFNVEHQDEQVDDNGQYDYGLTPTEDETAVKLHAHMVDHCVSQDRWVYGIG